MRDTRWEGVWRGWGKKSKGVRGTNGYLHNKHGTIAYRMGKMVNNVINI